MWQPRTWLDVRKRGYFLALAIASLGALFFGHGVYTLVTAKAPGDTHCYGGVCHRVYTLEETGRMIGKTVDLVATHYDWPEFDKFNVGQYTSSGEEFDAGNAARVSASNFPDGTELLLWHERTMRASHVRVNDFGPFKGNRTLDVTRRNAEVMGWAQNGVATLRVTVIWAPSSTEARYRRARVYPPSLGLIGVVQPHQYDAVAQMLIRTAAARNSGSGDSTPNTAALLASIPAPAPRFRTEAPDNAAEATAREATALQALVHSLPALAYAHMPAIDPVFVGPPAFRVEAITDAPQVARDAATAVAEMITRLPLPDVGQPLPSELMPPVVVAAAAPGLNPLPTDALSTVAGEAGAGRLTSNQPTVVPDVPASDVGARVISRPVSRPVRDEQVAQPTESRAAPVEREVVVASARVAGAPSRTWFESPAVWIGIGLMLSLWGAGAFARSRRGKAAVAIQQKPVDTDDVRTFHDRVDPLVLAREAAERAEARAKAALHSELANGPAASEAEITAREELARELDTRDLDREQEVIARERLAAAAAEHDKLLREIHAIESARSRRIMSPDIETPRSSPAAAIVPPAPVHQTKPVQAQIPAVLKPEPLRALANDHELTRFPGLADRALVGAVIDLPGALAYWGNTIIAQMSLEGSAKSGSPMRIDGTVDGAAMAPVLLISEGASVSGIAAAETIIVLGRVSGTISARRVFVAATAQVEGEIYYETMSIDPQAHCDVSFSRLPKESDPIGLATAVYGNRAA